MQPISQALAVNDQPPGLVELQRKVDELTKDLESEKTLALQWWWSHYHKIQELQQEVENLKALQIESRDEVEKMKAEMKAEMDKEVENLKALQMESRDEVEKMKAEMKAEMDRRSGQLQDDW